MTANEYQQAAMRTATKKCRDLGNCGLGLTGESGEVADMIKKHLFQGHDLDKRHMANELGDIAWYIAVAAQVIGYDLDTIFQMNIDKLRIRYPDGFNPERSVHRDPNDL